MRSIVFLKIFVFVLGACFWASGAVAQDAVVVRGGDHDGYTRIVFEWKKIPTYSVTKTPTNVTVVFNEKAPADLAGVAASLRNAKGIKKTSGADENLKLSLDTVNQNRVRDFVIGNKVVLDIYDDKDVAEPEREKPAQKQSESKPQTKEAVKIEAAPAPVKKTGEDFSVKVVEPAKPAPTIDVQAEAIKPPEFNPHTINLTTVTNVGLAVYERHGYLWIVTDTTDTQATPVLDGPQKEKFGTIEKIDLTGGRVYSLLLPDNIKVMVDGGGLSWKIILASDLPKDKTLTPVSPVRQSSDKGEKLNWPLQGVRRSLSFDDPISGDTVIVNTVTRGDQFSGDVRNFVDFSTLKTHAGLAYVARRDGVKSSVDTSGVEISNAKGLALSSAADSKTQEIRNNLKTENRPDEDAQKPTDLTLNEPAPDATVAQDVKKEIPETNVIVDTAKIASATKEKPTGNNIYNFPRWDMGGIKALHGNMHALLTEVAAKDKSAQSEDIITIAKLLLANNRAQESLGMLRIAVQQVPELEGTAEFVSLRGAALALSGKYDEAIVDFSRDDLKSFDDVKYWRAFTLAGLQDWKQAGDVLPDDLSAIKPYPSEVRYPLLLTYAEIALRNAKTKQARDILDIMREDLPELPLGYASSWNYLAGEAEKQAGNTERAKEYWTPLVKTGKDDLFRAKAGLSLTRLEIDQKKLKHDEAINRLEGLRYAWRGDELETLINYRLGQLYIDNKDYLKGLTVLRNATSMTPDLQIGQDVKTLMTSSFRDVFVNDRLAQMSPIDAISFYEEFKDLTPSGNEGTQYVEKLAERLVDADLLGRAASLLEYQVNNRLQGDKRVEVAIRLAAIRLLDGNPDGALRSLEIAQSTLDKIAGIVPETPKPEVKAEDKKPQDVAPQAGEDSTPVKNSAPTAPSVDVKKETVDPEKQRQIYLLKARALSMKKKPDEALAILEGMTIDADVSRLRTDIAWMAGKWEEAAMALNDLVIAEDISQKRPLTDYQRDIILNRGIALNLSGNRVALANLRERYNAQMTATAKGKIFDVVSRPRRPDMIGSREAIESMISEIDLFSDFLDSYAKSVDGKKPDIAPAPTAAPKPDDAKAAVAETPTQTTDKE